MTDPLPALFYVRDADGTIRPARTPREWAEFFENVEGRVVMKTPVPGGVLSTAFIGCNVTGTCSPALWETAMMWSDDRGIEVITRHASEEESVSFHKDAVRRLVAAFGGG